MLKLKSPQIIEFYIYLRDAHNIKINNKYFFFSKKVLWTEQLAQLTTPKWQRYSAEWADTHSNASEIEFDLLSNVCIDAVTLLPHSQSIPIGAHFLGIAPKTHSMSSPGPIVFCVVLQCGPLARPHL